MQGHSRSRKKVGIGELPGQREGRRGGLAEGTGLACADFFFKLE